MTTSIAALVMIAILFGAVSALLALVERRQNNRDSQRDQQIMLTDAIHWELGAAAAPFVMRRPGGGWRVSMAVPMDRPAEVAAILRVTERHFSADVEAAERLEIVLTPNRPIASSYAAKSLAPSPGAASTRLAA